MSEEYVYDKGRIALVVAIIVIISVSGFILVSVWPQQPPEIGGINMQATVYENCTDINDKYEQIFNVPIGIENTYMVKISVNAYNLYFVNNMIISFDAGENISILAYALVMSANEADIITGKNDFLATQRVYTKSLEIIPESYQIYVFLYGSNLEFYYDVRVGE